uniref:Centrosomal protein of 162 kDa n=1 Tax=Seriola lalandi dorsalis TaxID=1841481 RepID=A0A3B4YJX8_SERLL
GSEKLPCAKSSEKSAPKPAASWWQDDEHNGGGTGRGNNEKWTLYHTGHVSLWSMGLDTLEEEEEKARFFAQLEAGALSTIDYSKLNRELDSTSSTIGTNLRYGNHLGLILLQLKDCHSYVQSGGSEMEALHEAYRQIHVVEDSDDYNHHYSPVEGEERIHRPVSPSFTPQHARQSLQPASTNESGQTLTVNIICGNGRFNVCHVCENSCVAEELRLQLAQKETELQMMRAAAEELTSLRQQNFLLQSKLRRAEESSQRKRLSEDTETAAEDKLQHIHKEMKEQETLIKGYQQENEKLYLQVKAEQAKSKANEEAMFNENHRLLSELDFTRSVHSWFSFVFLHYCTAAIMRNEEKLSEDIHRLKQEKQALEVDLQLMKKERELAKAQAVSTSGDKTFEMSVLKDQHREEVSALSKKLQWFAENQDLLDRDADRLKAATAEIRQLKEQVEKLKTEVGRRSSEQQKKVKEKSVETTRMQELERQLQQILRHRNPNSLPALIYAAASAAEDEDAAKTAPPTVTVLEHRVRRLEAELENHDEGAKHSLRAMEQRFHSVKLRYEQQISELEQQLEQKQRVEGESSAAGIKPWMSQVQTLEAELQQVKEAHQTKEKSLGEQIESLQQQLKNRPPQQAQPSPGRHQRQAEAAFGVRIERLNHELATKTRTIQELSRTVERLQRERRSMLSVPSSRPETYACGEEVPAAQYEKTYQPTVFSGSHISEVLQENEALRRRLELLQLQTEQEKEALKAEAVQTKEELLKQQSAEQLSSIQTEHLRVLDQLCATHALEHSSSKVAEQANRINSQEQLEQLQGAKEALVTSRTRESALQRQLSRLLKELKEAKEAQSPEVKLLCSLERKLVTMELRHQHREKELTQVIGGSRQMLEANQQSEVEHWKHLAQDKSRELEAFRLELDSILDILRHLQRQGVDVVHLEPDTQHTHTHTHTHT